MFENFTPKGQNVLIKVDKAEMMSAGGIYIPTNDEDPISYGSVLAVGEGEYSSHGILIPTTVKVGDKICFHNYAGTEIESGLRIMEETCILGIFEK